MQANALSDKGNGDEPSSDANDAGKATETMVAIEEAVTLVTPTMISTDTLGLETIVTLLLTTI